MKNSKVKRILAITMIATMLCGTVVNATEPANSEVSTQEGDVLDGQEQGAEVQEDSEETSEDEELVTGEEAAMDEQTAALEQQYLRWLNRRQARAMVGTYASELARFPADYQTLLKQLHARHPNWIFVAVNTGLDWNEVVKQESISGSSSGTNRSLLPKSSASLLLSKASTDYDAAKGAYIPKDGSTWVSASKPAVAYYADPRNFLTDNYIYLFEALDFNEAYHTEQSVENVLKNTDLAGKKIEYVDTKGKVHTSELTYGQTILSAGAAEKVSPVFLASKIKQETGGKLTNGSISGDFSYKGISYRGYYNFYNIGATSTSTGSAVANGLTYAKGGTSGATSYARPWLSPLLAISGGAKFIGSSYISKGQNTLYYERFNTIAAPYYQHQYMQNLTGAASEAKSTYNSYQSMGIVDNGYVFYIPVYKNMPDQSGTISIAKNVKTGKTTSSVTLRKGPSASYAAVTTIPKDADVTVSGGTYTDKDVSVSSQQSNPYWFKVNYGSSTGYISANYLQMNVDSKIKAGATKQLSVSTSGGKTYYETNNPAVATVDDNGLVKGVKAGKCTVYAVNGSGKQIDAIGIEVTASSGSTGGGNTTTTPPTPPTPPTPTIKYDKYTTTTKVNYRSGAGTSYAVKGTLASGKEIDVEQGYSKSANGYTWYRFKLNGTNYYIASAYVRKGLAGESTNPNPPTLKYDKYTTTSNVNYRDGAGTLYAKKGTLSKGMQIEVEQGYSKSANGYTWYRFKLNGSSYYIASEYLKKGSSDGLVITPTPPTPAVKYDKYTTTTRVNYRIGAGTSYWTRGTLEQGKQIDVEQGYSMNANGYTWYRFNLNGTNYYIASKYLKKVSSGGSTVTPPAQTGKYSKYVTTTRVNYRIGAGTSYWTRGTLDKGKQIEVEQGYSMNANGYTWYRFKLNGTNYYIAAKYLKKV